MTRTRTSLLIALLVIGTVMSSLAATSAPAQPSVGTASTGNHGDVPAGFIELTGTNILRQVVIARARTDWAVLGVDVDASEVRVVRDVESGQILATNVDVTIRSAELVEGSSSIEVGAQFVVSADARRDDTLTPVSLQGAPYWTFYQNYCASQYYGALGSYIAECYQAKRLVNDGDGSYDYFSFHLYSTSGSSGPGFMDWVTIMSDPNHGFGYPTQYWVDWDPGTDWTGNCSSYTITVTYIISVPLTRTRCESWDITKYSTAAKFSQKWDGYTQSDREVAFATLTKVAQGQSPGWFWGFQYRVCYPWCEVEP